ncbi:hypothetical protein GCM10020221_05450 [Streptomyces thioluteus]|uniref:Uncharacterized protein n=1 Tax=Streptomyces thioluteus TaxID=66431 RepID=A0ABN3WF64_STRTU
MGGGFAPGTPAGLRPCTPTGGSGPWIPVGFCLWTLAGAPLDPAAGLRPLHLTGGFAPWIPVGFCSWNPAGVLLDAGNSALCPYPNGASPLPSGRAQRGVGSGAAPRGNSGGTSQR